MAKPGHILKKKKKRKVTYLSPNIPATMESCWSWSTEARCILGVTCHIKAGTGESVFLWSLKQRKS